MTPDERKKKARQDSLRQDLIISAIKSGQNNAVIQRIYGGTLEEINKLRDLYARDFKASVR